MLSRKLENPRLIVLLSALLVVAGLAALSTLPTSEDPRVMNRVATVLTPYPGATPERVEALVTEVLENALRVIPEIDVISSSSQAGISVVRIELKDSIKNTSPVWSEARDKIADIQPDLPAAAMNPRLDDTRGYAYTRLLAVEWTGSEEPDILTVGRYADELARRLRTIDGMDVVRRYGDPEEEIHVNIDPVRASQAGLSIGDVSNAILNRDAKVSAGQIQGGDRDWLIDVSGELENIQMLESTIVRTGTNGSALNLHEIAEISRSQQIPPREIALVEGKRAVMVNARMLPDVRIGQWSNEVDEMITSFSQGLPANLAIRTLFDQQRYTNERLGGLVGNILLGFAVILTVLFLTLGWRAALIVALALPLTVGFTLASMQFYGLPIHQMSVTGLVVALGIMVDNAIVMTDTIQRLKSQGLSRLEAVTQALNHLWLPLAGSTLTTILAFAPIAIMPGPAGEFVGGIAISVIFALVGSYLVSHTLIAGLAGRFLKPVDSHTGMHWPRLSRSFESMLRQVLNRPRAGVAVALVLPVLGFLAAGQMTEQFFPPSDRDMFTVEVHLDPATGIAATREMVTQANEVIERSEGIESLHWFIGGSAPSFYYNMMQRYDARPYFAQAMVTTKSFREANEMIPELQRQLDDELPGAQFLVRKLEQGPPFNAPIEVRIYGPSLDRLAQLGDQVRKEALATRHVVHARATLSKGRPKARLLVDENRVRRAGLAPVDLAAHLQATLDGVQAGSIIEATEELPIRLRLAEGRRNAPEDLYRLHIKGETAGPAVNALSLGELRYEPSAGVITRRQGERINTIEIYLRSGILPAEVQTELTGRIDSLLASSELTLPPTYRLEYGGESAERDNAVGSLLASVGLILVLLVTTVVLSFNSFRLSSIVFAVAGLAPGLGLLCVWLFGYPFGFVVIVGLMGLVGLAINAAIVIIAELRSSPMAVQGDIDAMTVGVMNCTRHIGSTTLTTLGGFMPLILHGGGFWPPFAIAIAGGTALASVLSFILVPAMFRLYARRHPFASSHEEGYLAPECSA